MNKVLFKFLIYFLLVLVKVSFAQETSLDSLKKLLAAAKHDTVKCRILSAMVEMASDEEWPAYNQQLIDLSGKQMKLCKEDALCKLYKEHYATAINNFSVLHLQRGELDKARDFSLQAVKIFEEIGDKKTLAVSLNNLGRISEQLGEKQKALEYYHRGLKLREEIKDSLGIGNTLANIGVVHHEMGQIEKALECYEKCLKIMTAINDKLGIANALANIGVVYYYFGDIEKTLDCYLKSLKMQEDINDDYGASVTLSNMGLIYMTQQDYEKAIEYYNKALKIQERTKDELGIAYTYLNMGTVYYNHQDYINADKHYEMSLALMKKMNDQDGTANAFINLGNVFKRKKDFLKSLEYYKNGLAIHESNKNKQGEARALNKVGNAFFNLNKYKEALDYCLKSMKLCEELKFPEDISATAEQLSSIYKKLGNYDKALEYYELFDRMRDSVDNESTRKAAMKAQLKYVFDKKSLQDSIAFAKETEIKNLAIKNQQAELKAKRNQQYALYGGLCLVILFSVFMFNRYKVTQKQKLIIEKKEKETQEQNKVISFQKLLVEEKQKEILDSISYAKRLQEAILPPQNLIDKYFPENFVFYKPKSIVAGDFYWFEHFDNSSFLAAADSTGHGVPGAMVSVVCSNALNRAVHEFGLRLPGEILDKTRELVLETFAKSDKDVKDGMDISLVKITELSTDNSVPGRLVIPKGQNLKEALAAQTKFRIEWAGANNPLWYFANGTMNEIKAHKQPIGKTDLPTPFPTHSIELRKGDEVFLFTDGFADQFGGPRGKKFKYKQLEEVLVMMADQSVFNQKEILEQALNNWKGSLEQVDDITVLGIKI